MDFDKYKINSHDSTGKVESCTLPNLLFSGSIARWMNTQNLKNVLYVGNDKCYWQELRTITEKFRASDNLQGWKMKLMWE